MTELLNLSTNFDKVAILRPGYTEPIQASLVMSNTALGRTRVDDIKTVLHRGLATFAALGEGVGDKQEVRRNPPAFRTFQACAVAMARRSFGDTQLPQGLAGLPPT